MDSVYREVLFRGLVKLSNTTYATHGLYMYPAKFIPHVVRYAIEKFTEHNDLVFDPFAGYGTVAVEASLTGRNAEVWDLNPITRVLTLASTCRELVSVKDFEIEWDYDERFNPRWGNIHYWHPPQFYEALSRAWGYWHYVIMRSDSECVAYLKSIPLLKITRYFSYADEKISKTYRSKYAKEKVKTLLSTDWKYVMRKMYWKYVEEVVRKVNEYHRIGPKDVEITIRTSWRDGNGLHVFDALREELSREAELLVTSPPYLQAQEYIRSFKIELAWLGFTGSDLTILSRHEIPYNIPPPVKVNSKLYLEYRAKVAALKHRKLLEIYDAYFKSLVNFLNNNAKKCHTLAIFVGPVKIRTERVPIDEILKEHLESLGFRHVETLIDRIVARRLFNSKVNPATGLPDERTPTEHLLVMTK